MKTDTLVGNRVWIVVIVILICALMTPSQFQKGGISRPLLIAIPVAALLLSYLYTFFLSDIPTRERLIVPFILWPVVYISITFMTETLLDRIFDDYEFAVKETRLITFLVNLFYYALITLPVFGLTRIYCRMFRYK